MEFKITTCTKLFTDEQLIGDLQRAARATGRNTISRDQYKVSGEFSPTTISRRFGTWNKALQQAGLEVYVHDAGATHADLLENLMRLWMSLGRQPRLSDLTLPISKYGEKVYLRLFGKWSRALTTFVANAKRIKDPADFHHCNLWYEPLTQRRPGKKTRQRDVPAGLRNKILTRDNFRCLSCGASPATDTGVRLHVDHIVPWSKGGETVADNLQTLCADCNLGKGAN